MKTAITAALSLLVGLGLGRLAFHADPVVQQFDTKTVERVEVPGQPRTVVIETAVKVKEVPQGAPALASPTPTAAPSFATPPVTDEVVTLRAQVEQLQAELKREREARQGTEGEKVPVPPGLPARLRDEQRMVAAFNAALKEAGFPGQVSNVDCSEHPCIVFGNGFGERGDMEKLQTSPAFAEYAKDSMYTFGFQRGKDPKDTASRFFGVALMPGDSEAAEAVKKRIAFRVHQMEEVSRPAK